MQLLFQLDLCYCPRQNSHQIGRASEDFGWEPWLEHAFRYKGLAEIALISVSTLEQEAHHRHRPSASARHSHPVIGDLPIEAAIARERKQRRIPGFGDSRIKYLIYPVSRTEVAIKTHPRTKQPRAARPCSGGRKRRAGERCTGKRLGRSACGKGG